MSKTTTIEFDAQTVQLLDNLMRDSFSKNRVQTLRKALFLLKMATDTQTSGQRLVLEHKSGEQTEIRVF